MTSDNNRHTDRRQWLRTCVRNVLLGGLALGAAWLHDRASRHSGRASAGRSGTKGAGCATYPICTQCGLLPGCGLPEAVAARRQQKETPND